MRTSEAATSPHSLSSISLSSGVSGLALLVMLFSSGIDMFGGMHIADYSAQAFLTVAYLFFGIVLLIAIPTCAFIPKRSVWFLVFLFWGYTSLLWTPAPVAGVQNLLVITTLFVLSLVSEALTVIQPSFAKDIARYLGWSVVIATLIYGAATAWYGMGTSDLQGARTYSLFALFGVAQNLASWRYGRRMGLLWATAITVLIGVSQSRFSLGIAVAMFPLAQIPTRRILSSWKMITVGAFSIGLAGFSVFYFEALRSRFFTGDVSMKVGDYAINGSGRIAFWNATLDSFWEAPWFGKGAGSSQHLVESVFVSMTHPHSDYLRVAHDYGILGSALWAAALLSWLMFYFGSWRRADAAHSDAARYHLTALLCLVSFILQMLMENTLVYVFIAAPLGLLLGAAAALGPRKRIVPTWL